MVDLATKMVVLCDFGLAKETVVPEMVVCGTPTYMAPEIVALSLNPTEFHGSTKAPGYGKEVDIWAIGVVSPPLPPPKSLQKQFRHNK